MAPFLFLLSNLLQLPITDKVEASTVVSLFRKAERVLVLAGAGMSAELNVQTYWVGVNARYGATISDYGYTDLEHATESLWLKNPQAQSKFYESKRASLDETPVTQENSPYAILHSYVKDLPHFTATTNVDSFFVRSGEPEAEVFEVHGSYRYSQCLSQGMKHGIFPAASKCPECDSLARPNTLFFSDYGFNSTRRREEEKRFLKFRKSLIPSNSIVLEIGVGKTVPVLREYSSYLSRRKGLPVIRINPRSDRGTDITVKDSPRAPFIEMNMTAGEALLLLCQG